MKNIRLLPRILLTASCFFLATAFTDAQSWTQLGNTIAGDSIGAFGKSLCLSSDGNFLAVGTPHYDINVGFTSLYEKQSGKWVLLGNLSPGGFNTGYYGYSVSLDDDGSVLAIGSPFWHGAGVLEGRVQVFSNSAGSLTQIGSDIVGTNYDICGMSVSLSSDGNVVAVGATGMSGHDEGYVRVYENQGGTWTQIGGDIVGEAISDVFGTSVSLSSNGTIVAVGAPYNSGTGYRAGHVRVYKKGLSGNWVQIANDIDGEAAGDEFGWSVSLNSDGTIVAVGAYKNDGNGTSAGHVRVYQNILNNWVQVGSDIDGEAALDQFGISVSLSSDGSMVAAGAYTNDGGGTDAGHARVFKNISGTWTQVGSDIDGAAAGDNFGYSVGLSSDGATLAAGAPGDSVYYDYGYVNVYTDGTVVACKTLPSYNISVTPNGNTWETRGPLDIWWDGCYLFKVNQTIGKNYTFQTGCGNGATANFDTFIQVYKADGTTLITVNDDGCESARSKVTWTATENSAFVRVSGYTPDDYGSSTIAYWSDAPAIPACRTIPDFDAEVTPSANAWNTDGPHSITGNADCHIYKVNLTIGKEYTFKTGCGDGATADFDSWIEVFEENGTSLIVEDDQSCESLRSKVTWTATEDIAWVVVSNGNQNSSGDFTVAYSYEEPLPVTCKTPPDFHSEVTPAENSWNIDGPRAFGTNDCYVYKVNCTIGKSYTVKTGCGDGATADFDTFLEVYNSTGSWIADNDDGCSDHQSTVTWTATETVAYVRVRGYNSTQFGLFTLAHLYASTPTVTCKTPPDYDYTVAITGSWQTHPATASSTITVSSGSCKIYEVTGIAASTSYTFKTGCGDDAMADFDTFLELYDASGGWLAGNDDECAGWTSYVTWTSPAGYTGKVFLKVRGYSDAKFGEYRMAYKQGASAPPSACTVPPLFDVEVTPSTTWAADSQTIGSDACYVYKVNTTTGNDYTFMTGCGPVGTVSPTATFDTWIDLYNSSGILIASDDDGCPDQWRSKIEWTATETAYFVKVRGWRADRFGDYTVAYSSEAAPPPSACVTPPDSDETLPVPTTGWQNGGSDNVTSDGCYVYKVAVTSGNTYTFKTGCGDGASAAADFDTYLELYDASGGWLAEDDDGCKVPAANDYTSKLVWAANFTGSVYLKVRGWNSTDYGAVTMAYSFVTTGPDALELGTEEDIARNQVKVFPNPANYSFTVASQEPLSFTKVIVSEFTGRTVISWDLAQPVTSLRIESSGFAQGVYILSIETSEGWIRKKVSVVR